MRRADRPATNPDARYSRALQRLSSGDVDQALAETMRLPGAANAPDWVDKARRYIAAHRALDEIESRRSPDRRQSGGLSGRNGLGKRVAECDSRLLRCTGWVQLRVR